MAQFGAYFAVRCVFRSSVRLSHFGVSFAFRCVFAVRRLIPYFGFVFGSGASLQIQVPKRCISYRPTITVLNEAATKRPQNSRDSLDLLNGLPTHCLRLKFLFQRPHLCCGFIDCKRTLIQLQQCVHLERSGKRLGTNGQGKCLFKQCVHLIGDHEEVGNFG